jgi:hypothetical protein
MRVTEFDRPKLERLKKAYEARINDKDRTGDTFTFEGFELVEGYAEILIEYLEERLCRE